MLRVAVSAVAIMAFVGIVATPAHADNEITVSPNPGNVSLEIGGGNQVATVVLSPNHGNASYSQVTVDVNLSDLQNVVDYELQGGTGCQTQGNSSLNCGSMAPGQGLDFRVAFSPAAESNLQEGQTASGSFDIQVRATDATSQQQGNSFGSIPVTVMGTASSEPTVTEVSGTARNMSDGKALKDVKIVVTDGSGTKHEGTSGSDGSFAIFPPSGGIIEPGKITVTATKSGFEKWSQESELEAGDALDNVVVNMAKEVKETEDPGSQPPAAADDPGQGEDIDATGLGPGTIILIILGILFVGGGVTAIVLLIRRNKQNPDDDEELFGDKPPDHTPLAAQTGSPGVYDAKRNPRMDQPTMIHNGPLVMDDEEELARYGSGATQPGFGPSYGAAGADQPTQLHDPYGPPSPAGGQPTQMFDPRGETPGGPEKTQMFDPREVPGQRDPYDRDRGYESGGYGDRGGYGGAAPASGAGYGGAAPASGAGYGASPASGAGYGAAPASGAGYGASPTSGPGYGASPTSGPGYGAPAPDRGGYGGAAPTSGTGYGTPPSSAPPSDRGGYGASPSSGGPVWPDRDDYGRQAPPSPSPERGGYGSGYGGGQQSGYPAPPPASPDRGYGPPSPAPDRGYGEPPTTGGGYGAPPPASPEPGGYGQDRGGYGGQPPQGGYGDDRGYPPQRDDRQRRRDEYGDRYDDRGYDDRPSGW